MFALLFCRRGKYDRYCGRQRDKGGGFVLLRFARYTGLTCLCACMTNRTDTLPQTGNMDDLE